MRDTLFILGLGKSGFYAALLAVSSELYKKIYLYDDTVSSAVTKRIERLVVEGKKRGVEIVPLPQAPDINGVNLLIKSPGVPFDHPIIGLCLTKGIEIVDEVEFAYRLMNLKTPVVGITGTNGKTTTTSLVAEILKVSGFSVFAGGNLGEPLSSYVLSNRKCDFVVLELSSFQLAGIKNFSVFVGAILNIDEDHIDYHKTFDAYVEAKFNLFSNFREDSKAVLRLDPLLSRWFEIKKLPVERTFWFSESPFDDVSGAFVREGKIFIKDGGELIRLFSLDELNFQARFNLENILAALMITYLAGCDISSIRTAVLNFQWLSHRMEPVGNFRGITVINDSKATNPHAVKRALGFVRGNVILIMGGIAKDFSFSSISPLISEKVKLLVLYGEARDLIEKELAPSGVEVISVGDFTRAVEVACKKAVDGDTILLSPGCASFDQFSGYEERGDAFKEVVKSILGRSGV